MRKAELLYDNQSIVAWKTAKKLSLHDSLLTTRYRKATECMDWEKLQDGQHGYLGHLICTVVQVAGPKDALLRFGYPHRSKQIWLTGYPTKELVDGEQVFLVGLVTVKGTKTYESALSGSGVTVQLIAFASEEIVKKAEAIEVAKNKAIADEKEEAKYRTWTSKSGKHSVIAKFDDYVSGEVFLKKRGGKRIKVLIAQLSLEDRMQVKTNVADQRNAQWP
jgi:hypothetical protein